ncbi:uncharacterized protein OCT59_023181 [Rhizophagus irregularis]|nr:hypothetical protein OCT59_023181 [Rhizophagus irregularis]GBC34993.2 hypothetical protein RIR_jg36313.t1 [Rhizophagus irregularis DAOM 181602=DAOM 197198]
MEKEIILETAASYQDRDGILILTPKRLQWSVQGEKSPTIDIATLEIKNLFVGKPNVADAKFKIKCTDYNNQEITHTIVLKSPSAWQDLEIIKAKVRNKGPGRSAAPSPAPQQSAGTSPVHYKSAAPSPASGGSSPAVWNNNNKNGTPTNGRNSTTPLRKVTPREINLRMNLLLRDKKLADQHRMLVVEQKCITEEEFWELRKNLLRDQDTRTSQQKGRSSTMPNLRPVTEEGGEAKINITPQLINEIFEEYPRVKIAYEKNVPTKISEEVFWKRYVHSKFNDRNRGTSNVNNDDIFEKCWAETEDDLNQEREHGRKRLKISNLRDLSATKEDHMEIDFAPDVTMRAGQGKILSLLRRNNRHGERILETSCEKSRNYKEAMAQQQKEIYKDDIVMDELIEEESPNTYKLDITDQREYFASQATEIDNDVEMVDADQSSIKHQNSIEILNKFRDNFRNWKPNLTTKSLFPRKVDTPIPNLVTQKCNEMIEDKQNRMRESKPKIEYLPQKIEKEVNVIQLMGNEFLRHFWASVDLTVKEKVEKNKRMIEQLKSILTKIDQISELKPSEEDIKQGLNLPNGSSNNNTIQKDQEPKSVVINGKRVKIGSKGGNSFEQVNGSRPDSNGSPRIDSEWKDALIQAQQMLNPLCNSIEKALSHNQGVNISRPNSRQGPSAVSQSFQKSARTSSPGHHKTGIRDSKTPDLYKAPRDTKSIGSDIQRPVPRDIRDIKQPQHHHGRTVNRETKQVINPKTQKSSNHDMQQSLSSEVQKSSNRQFKQGSNMKQDISRVNPKVSVRNGITQAQSDTNRESRTTIKIQKRNIQQNTSRDDSQSNGRDTLKSSNINPARVSSGSSEISSQVSSANRIKVKRKR